MFADLIRRLTDPEPEPIVDDDARLALTALLVRIARSDGDYAPAERSRIDRIVRERFDLSEDGARDLRSQAEALEAGAPDTVRFTRAIKDGVPYEERVGVIAALWQIVLADGRRDAEEDSLLRMVAPMLGVSDRDSNIARRRVEGD